MLKGVVIGSSAAVAVGCALAAAAVVSGPEAPPAAGRMRIVLTPPPAGPKLDTLPPGLFTFGPRREAIKPESSPRPRAAGPVDEERGSREPAPRLQDFADSDEAFPDAPPEERYGPPRGNLRRGDGRYGEDRYADNRSGGRYEDRYGGRYADRYDDRFEDRSQDRYEDERYDPSESDYPRPAPGWWGR